MIFIEEGDFFINIEELKMSVDISADRGSREPILPGRDERSRAVNGRMRHTTMHLLHYNRRCHNGKESRRIH